MRHPDECFQQVLQTAALIFGASSRGGKLHRLCACFLFRASGFRALGLGSRARV